MKRRKVSGVKVTIFLLFLCALGAIVGIVFKNTFGQPKFQEKDFYVASETLTVPLYDETYTEVDKITRGSIVTILQDKNEYEGHFYYKIRYDGKEYFILESALTEDIYDVVREKEMYVKISATIYDDSTSSKIKSFVKRSNNVDVIGYDKMNEDGSINMYKIRYNDIDGYVYSKYLAFSEDDIDENAYDEYHKNRKFSYELYGGKSENLDYSYREKPSFDDNVLIDEARTLYLTGSKWTLANVEEYITLAKNNNINAFVVDIKDGFMAYESDIAKEYSISNYNSYSNTKEQYLTAINKLKDEGFYVIGRIVAFNDSNFAKDNPDEVITSANGSKTSWVSAYSRLAWEFNVELAKEAINLFGFNEIQYDYVRFPESSYWYSDNNYNFKNKYNEDKAEAVQNFLMYAADEIHKLHVYLSADVFGESAESYVTAYGQYWPAISNVVDAISAMPYTDHFGNVASYWEKPYNLLYSWGSKAAKRQTEIPTPAIARTWITAYDVPYWNSYITCDSEYIAKQIQALYDAGLRGGVITWKADSSLSKYRLIASAFKKEY